MSNIQINMKNCLIFFVILFMITGCEISEEDRNSIQINNIDLNKVLDGTYEGEYRHDDSEGFSKVKVTVENYMIKEVDLIELSASPVGRKAQYVLKSVMKEQSVNVDVVSGATISSLVVLKSTELALQKGITKE